MLPFVMTPAERLRKFKLRRGGAAAYRNVEKAKWPEKYHARKVVEWHVKAGNIIKQPCAVCQAPKVHAHHDDYSEPLVVMWLCPLHHKARHKVLKQIERDILALVA